MKYTEFKVGENEYKLRLGAQQVIQVEKKLGGKNVLDMFMKVGGNSMPTLNECLIVLHGSMQKLNHGVTMEKVYDIYDEYVEEGNTYTDLMPVLIDVMKVSGFFKEKKQKEGESEEEKTEKEQEKNTEI